MFATTGAGSAWVFPEVAADGAEDFVPKRVEKGEEVVHWFVSVAMDADVSYEGVEAVETVMVLVFEVLALGGPGKFHLFGYLRHGIIEDFLGEDRGGINRIWVDWPQWVELEGFILLWFRHGIISFLVVLG